MRIGWIVVAVLLLVTGPIAAGAAGIDVGSPALALANVSHTLDGATLIITGWVENRGPTPVARLVVDASGFAPSGDLVASGSDGIPWEIPAGGTERFTIALPIRGQLIREYIVQVSFARPPFRPLADVRRGVDVAMYRPLLFSMVSLTGMIRSGILTVRSDVRGLPVTLVTVSATVLLQHDQATSLEALTAMQTDVRGLSVTLVIVKTTALPQQAPASRVQALTLELDVPADGVLSVSFGVRNVTLLVLRVVDLRLKTVWTD